MKTGMDQQNQEERAVGNPETIKVLVYHRIVDDRRLSDAHWSCVHIERFRKHLELLDRMGYTTMTFKDYLLFLEGQLNLPAKPVILTFDDGYLETYRFAFPLLQEFGMTAVLFVLGERKIKTNYWDQRMGMPEAPLMEREQIIEMHEAGFEIGAHSMTHAKLTLLSESSAWEEISRSRILLEILLNDTVHTFSYPFGLLNGRLKRMVHSAGYRLACGVYSGPAVFGADRQEIRRLTVINSCGTMGLAFRMATPFQYYAWLRWRIRTALAGQQHFDEQIQKIVEKKNRQVKKLQSEEILEEYGPKG